jgi:hypothetical protein
MPGRQDQEHDEEEDPMDRYVTRRDGVTDLPMAMVPGFGFDRYLALKGLI